MNGKEKIYSREEKQSWWSQIKFYQRQREDTGKPISDGWCAHTFKKKFGVWPRNLHDTPIEITPTVSNYIRSKQIAWAKTQEKQPKPSEPEPVELSKALDTVRDIKEKLAKRRSQDESARIETNITLRS